MSTAAPALPLIGGCNCGAVRFVVSAPLAGASYCHCKRCQRRSGAAASPNAHPVEGSFRIVAGENRLRVWKPENGGEKWFCGECGSPMFARNPAHPQSVAIRMGTFDGDPGVRPMARQVVDGLSHAAWALAAVSACAEYGVIETLREPAGAEAIAATARLPVDLATRLLDVCVALGLVTRDDQWYAASPGAAQANAMFPGVPRAFGRTALLQVHDLYRCGRARGLAPTGWQHTDADLLEAQGVASAGVVPGFRHLLFPRLDGLTARLAAPGAAFLDMGAGVAGLSIAFARAFPAARCVALEPADAPFRLACEHVEEAGLAERIELRRQRVEELEDLEHFDVAWLPVPFLAPEALPAVLERVWRALRPGGWVLLATADTDDQDLASAVAALRCTLWGGAPLAAQSLHAMLADAGFIDVRPASAVSMPGAPVQARRPPAADRRDG